MALQCLRRLASSEAAGTSNFFLALFVGVSSHRHIGQVHTHLALKSLLPSVRPAPDWTDYSFEVHIMGSTSVGEGKTYSIPNIRSEDSGEYTCQSRNDHGETRSIAVQMNVKYPPKRVSVSISPSGEIVEGSSVTLTCSSHANPPVKIYTWFKEGGTSPVGSGHSYSPLQSGSYYCEAQNQHGAQNATAVSVIVKGNKKQFC
ncbi:hypothetical protein SRHO_G00178760 [Serrasalmus rhombeus]